MIWSIAVGAVAAYGLGVAIATFTGRSRWRTGARQLAAAAVAATVTFVVGRLLGTTIAG